MIANFVLACLAISMLVFVWVFAFFIFDTEVLNGHFKKKLQNKLNGNDISNGNKKETSSPRL